MTVLSESAHGQAQERFTYLLSIGPHVLKVGVSTDPLRRMREIYSDLAGPVRPPVGVGGPWARTIQDNITRIGLSRVDREAMTLVATHDDPALERIVLDRIRVRAFVGAGRREYLPGFALDDVLALADWDLVGLRYRDIVTKSRWSA